MRRVVAAGAEIICRRVPGCECCRLAADQATAGLGGASAASTEKITRDRRIDAGIGIEQCQGLEAEVDCAQVALLLIWTCVEDAKDLLDEESVAADSCGRI